MDGAASRTAVSTASRASSSASWNAIWKPRLSRGSVSDSASERAAGSNRRSAPASGRTVTLQPVRAAQPLGQRVVHLVRRRGEFRGDRLGRRLQRREMVGALVEEVPRLLVRQQDAPAGGQRDAARILPRHAPGAIEREHRARGVRRGRRPARRPRPRAPARRPAAGRRRPPARPLPAAAPRVPESVARSTRSVSASLISRLAVTARCSCSIRLR